jgi:hypothetical protein
MLEEYMYIYKELNKKLKKTSEEYVQLELDLPDPPMTWEYPEPQDYMQQNYSPCVDCPNSPKNGGSGTCNCMLPYLYNLPETIC